MNTRSLLLVVALVAACQGDPDMDDCEGAECEGAARLEVSFCRQVSIAATPARTFVGRRIALEARTPDVAADALRARWSAQPDGSFDANTYLCETPGSKQLHVEVSDARGCKSDSDVTVDCVSE